MEEYSDKININELYNVKQKKALAILNTFKLILSRIHNKIKKIADVANSQPLCIYEIPLHIIGHPVYDFKECVSYIMNKLVENGFEVKYLHPSNYIIISWENFVPQYVRNEIQKTKGISINEKGEIIQPKKSLPQPQPQPQPLKPEQQPLKVDPLPTKVEPSKNSIYDAKLLKLLESTIDK